MVVGQGLKFKGYIWAMSNIVILQYPAMELGLCEPESKPGQLEGSRPSQSHPLMGMDIRPLIPGFGPDCAHEGFELFVRIARTSSIYSYAERVFAASSGLKKATCT